MRLPAKILNQAAQYQVTAGYVANRRDGEEERRGPTMEELRDEISDEDLEAVIDTIMKHKGWRPPELPAAPS